MNSSATFSRCRAFRYELNRIWDISKPKVLFIGLNPSKAKETDDDPTIRRCIKFANSWGFGGLSIVNLFAFCTHDPNELFKAIAPIGPKNDKTIKNHLAKYENVILVWGNHGNYLKRNEEVLKLIKNPLCLKINKNGSPAHPLYLKSDLIPIPYTIKNEDHCK